MKKNKISVWIPNAKQSNYFFERRMEHEYLPHDWRTNPRYRMDYPAEGLLFDTEKRCYTGPFFYLLGMAEWIDEKNIMETS